ncbi:MAG: zinc finger-like domain-containing protein [Deltaproteobacteria bacterium]|nr:zinc finger-like domain-containing protein [Deltaproteobacteria bacterium]
MERKVAADARRVHLGIDYGTSWSKVVFRDYEDPQGDLARVVPPSDAPDAPGGASLQFPSLVTWHEERLWFGWEAERRRPARGATPYGSVKVRMALPDAFSGSRIPFPEGLGARELAALTVLYLAQQGTRAAQRHTRRFGCEPRVSMTIGAPMSQLNEDTLRGKFVEVARMANWMLSRKAPELSDGLSGLDARRWIDEASAAIASKPSNWRAWVRSEVESALIWPFRSPSVRPGLYAAIDVGAGTTDSSFFRITERFDGTVFQKHGLAIFGAASGPPGVDAIDAAIARPGEDPLSVRMRENERLGAMGGASNLPVFGSIFEKYQEAFSRAYAKDERQTQWFPYGLFLVGGGAQIERLRAHLRRRPWEHLDGDPEVLLVSIPRDLAVDGGGAFGNSEVAFLIAYGLSFIGADVPEARTPDEVPGFYPLRSVSEAGASGSGFAGAARPCTASHGYDECAFCGGSGWVLPPTPNFGAPPITSVTVQCPHCGATVGKVAEDAHLLGCPKRPGRLRPSMGPSVVARTPQHSRLREGPLQPPRKSRKSRATNSIASATLIQCSECPALVKNLEKHMRKAHSAGPSGQSRRVAKSVPRDQRCPNCGLRFTAENLVAHQRRCGNDAET